MKSIVVTAADENFSALLLRLIDSLHQWDEPLFDAVGLLDVGLSEATLRKIRGQITHVATPAWDLPCGPRIRQNKPYLRAKTARPFLPRYFPGYDLYLWLDADTWVQEKFALEWFFQAAQGGSLGIVPQADPSYVHTRDSVTWRTHRLSQYYGDESLTLLNSQSYYNGGAFSLLAGAPHWNSWAHHFARGLESCPWLISDQTALNYAIWKDNLPVSPLPSLCNWCWHLAAPITNAETGKLCEPSAPNRPIGLIHMTAHTKDTAAPRPFVVPPLGGPVRQHSP